MVSIWKRKLKKGKTAIYFCYYQNGKQVRELSKYILRAGQPSSNKQTMRTVEALRSIMESDHANKGYGITRRKGIGFIGWAQKKGFGKNDKRMYNAVVGAFKSFLGQDEISTLELNAQLILEFKVHLKKFKGETPHNYFAYFKRMLKAGDEAGILQDPSMKIKNHPRKGAFNKQVLMAEEIRRLARTPCTNPEIKRAFLFSTQTGLRYCDIILLQWSNIHADYIDFGQKKTGERNIIPLNPAAVFLLGERSEGKVFSLPSSSAVNKDLKVWMKKAKINKHITYHCARHSLATNLLISGIDLKTVASTMGHASARTTEKYTHISEAMIKKAVNSLPDVF